MTRHYEFIAIDVETANYDIASICQIGLVWVTDGKIIREWKTYLDPEDYFDQFLVSKHGIDEITVAGAPTFYQIASELYEYLNGKTVVCHTHFDRASIRVAANRYEIDCPDCNWLDSARVTRRTWNDLAHSGYGLKNVCQKIGFDFQHHDALEDAKAAAQIMIEAISKTRIDSNGWLIELARPKYQTPITAEGEPEGPMYGDVIVFTGALSVPRRDAARMAAQVGCTVSPSVTKETTILVVGDQDLDRLAGHEKSSKHRKAEKLIEAGQELRIISESDFSKIVSMMSDSEAS